MRFILFLIFVDELVIGAYTISAGPLGQIGLSIGFFDKTFQIRIITGILHAVSGAGYPDGKRRPLDCFTAVKGSYPLAYQLSLFIVGIGQ